MRACDVCGKPFTFAEPGWRSVAAERIRGSAAFAGVTGPAAGEDWRLCPRCAARLPAEAPPDEPPVPLEAAAMPAAPPRPSRGEPDEPPAAKPRPPRPPAELAALPGRAAWRVLLVAGLLVLAAGLGLAAATQTTGWLARPLAIVGVGVGGTLLAGAAISRASDRDVSPGRILLLQALSVLVVSMPLAALAAPLRWLAGIFLFGGLALAGWVLSQAFAVIGEEQRRRWAEDDLQRAQRRPPRPRDESADR